MMPLTLDDFVAQETDDPDIADKRGFFKVELWDEDGLRPVKLLYAGNRVGTARSVFSRAVIRNHHGRYTVKRGIRVLWTWQPG
jgi:hypothetical protein